MSQPSMSVSSAPAGGIDRLAAFDGLFLRAEHLDRIQSYARDLLWTTVKTSRKSRTCTK